MPSLKLTDPETNDLIERTYDAFVWRKLPDEVWDQDHSEVDQFQGEFLPLTPSEFGFDVYESEPWCGQGEAINSMTVEGFLYYLPSFLALLLQDWKRCKGLETNLFSRLRSCVVFPGPYMMWHIHIQLQPMFKGSFAQCIDPDVRRPIDNLLDWYFHKAESSQCDPIVQMTLQEREVVAQCLGCFGRTLKDDWLHGWRWTVNWIEAVRGVLLDAPLSRRLGARNDTDVADLLLLLDMSSRTYPRVFSTSLIEPLKKELHKEVATLPPSASRRFAASDTETRDITDQAFETFSWRTLPKTLWSEFHYDAEEFEQEFRPVPPREFDFEVFESEPFLGNGENMFVLTHEAQLYYLPSFLARILQDCFRTDGFESCIFGALRGYGPSRGPFVGWIPYVREPEAFDGSFVDYLDTDQYSSDRRSIVNLLNWFVLDVEPNRRNRVTLMTRQEREVVARWLDHFENLMKNEDLYDWQDDAAWIEAVRGVLLDGPSSSRLGARNDEDVADLIDLLEMAERLYPQIFSSRLTESIDTQLYEEIGSWDT